nr:glycogen debranching enzyme GlgX [Gemmatimonadota bacterium]
GNNNAYCRDDEIAWVDWDLDTRQRELLAFAARVFAIRRGNPVLRRRSFFSGGPTGDGAKDVAWVREDGDEMTLLDWSDPQRRMLGMLVDGQATDEVDERGEPIRGDTLFLVASADNRARLFRLPELPTPGVWRELVNTARPTLRPVRAGRVRLTPNSLVLLRYEAVA